MNDATRDPLWKHLCNAYGLALTESEIDTIIDIAMECREVRKEKHSDYVQSCFVFAARYAGGRNTGAAFTVSHAIMENWHKLDASTQDAIIRESFGALYNYDDWQKLRDFAKSKEEAK